MTDIFAILRAELAAAAERERVLRAERDEAQVRCQRTIARLTDVIHGSMQSVMLGPVVALERLDEATAERDDARALAAEAMAAGLAECEWLRETLRIVRFDRGEAERDRDAALARIERATATVRELRLRVEGFAHGEDCPWRYEGDDHHDDCDDDGCTGACWTGTDPCDCGVAAALARADDVLRALAGEDGA